MLEWLQKNLKRTFKDGYTPNAYDYFWVGGTSNYKTTRSFYWQDGTKIDDGFINPVWMDGYRAFL